MLTAAEAGRLEHYGLWPSCKLGLHEHVRRSKAEEMVAADTHRFVGGKDTKVICNSYIVETNNGRTWQPVPCHDEGGNLILGFRIWGLPSTRLVSVFYRVVHTESIQYAQLASGLQPQHSKPVT